MVYTFYVSVQYDKIVNTFLYQSNIAPLSVSMTIRKFQPKGIKMILKYILLDTNWMYM